jgi:hypothetical protein
MVALDRIRLAAPRRIHNAALCHLGLAGPGPCVLAPTRILCPRALILATLGFVRRPAAPWTRSRQSPPGALRPCSQGRSSSPDVSGPASGPLARSGPGLLRRLWTRQRAFRPRPLVSGAGAKPQRGNRDTASTEGQKKSRSPLVR